MSITETRQLESTENGMPILVNTISWNQIMKFDGQLLQESPPLRSENGKHIKRISSWHDIHRSQNSPVASPKLQSPLENENSSEFKSQELLVDNPEEARPQLQSQSCQTSSIYLSFSEHSEHAS
jgi:hypothetical protein